jgi:hypothetical protein
MEVEIALARFQEQLSGALSIILPDPLPSV